MSPEPNIDVSNLPSYAFDSRGLMWWGTLGIIAVEGTVFVLVLAGYFYLRQRTAEWPPGGLPAPELRWGTLNTVVLLVSLVPNYWTDRVAKRHDLRGVRIGLPVCLGFAVVFLIIRVFEFGALNIRWDNNAYGSIVWVILGLHTVHLATDTADTAVLALLMFTGPLEGRRFSDVNDNAFYWYFVVLAWIPIYAVVYLAPRWL
jgi:heme/copper-type cytochrome/quinol oxidase subunit 3